MLYVEAPQCKSVDEMAAADATGYLFLAGGITNCPDWQAQALEALKDTELAVFNPRRADFPIHDPSAAEEQIRWEYRYLTLCHHSWNGAILFWFPKETLCPIALFELGAHLRAHTIFIGTHPEYQRRRDVVLQSELGHYRKLRIHDNLEEMLAEVKIWAVSE